MSTSELQTTNAKASRILKELYFQGDERNFVHRSRIMIDGTLYQFHAIPDAAEIPIEHLERLYVALVERAAACSRAAREAQADLADQGLTPGEIKINSEYRRASDASSFCKKRARNIGDRLRQLRSSGCVSPQDNSVVSQAIIEAEARFMRDNSIALAFADVCRFIIPPSQYAAMMNVAKIAVTDRAVHESPTNYILAYFRDHSA